MKQFQISVVVPTYNSAKTLEALLKSIRVQEYDQEKIEIILADGGSIDETTRLAKKYNAQIYPVQPKIQQSAEFNRAFGVHKAKNEILAFFDHDNILPTKHFLKEMIEPLAEDKKIIGVETLQYAYDSTLSLLDRYFALFGINDPLSFYLGKADRQSYIYDQGYHLMGKAIDKGKYYSVEFNRNAIPTIGSNGFLIRREILMQQADTILSHFFHIDVNVDLINKGYNRYAFVKNSIIHISGHNDFFAYLSRRILYMKKYYIMDKNKRRYSVYEKKDLGKLILFIIYSLTFIKPLSDALRGYRKIHDIAWFLHPFMCCGTVIVYSYAMLRYSWRQ